MLDLSRSPGGTPRIGELIVMSALCHKLGSAAAQVEPPARALEQKGLVVCAPSTGRIAVLAVAKVESPGPA